MGNSRDIPGSKVDAINLLWLGESGSEGKKRVEAGNKGQETSHSDQKVKEYGAQR